MAKEAAEQGGGGRRAGARAEAAARTEQQGGLVGLAEAVSLLKTSPATLYRWVRTGRLHGTKAGRQWRFRREDIERFLRGEGQPAVLPADIQPLIAQLAAKLRELGWKDTATKGEQDAVRAVSQMIVLCYRMRGSDLHIGPNWDAARTDAVGVVRCRVDGVLHVVAEFDVRLLRPLVLRWKSMAACNVHENTKPQDGRVLVTVERKHLDLRVSFVPALYGESVTVRLLDASAVMLRLSQMDYSPAVMAQLEPALRAPWGIVVVAGPTGSGKTTTLYGCVSEVAKPAAKVMSIESPVEYVLPWVTQIQVDPAQGLTFPVALRSVLRSDPDVILIGEIRDRETLVTAQQAALTGHVVLTTLHADDAARTVRRMVEVGGEPFLVAETAKLVMSQRLVRCVCQACGQPADLPPAVLQRAAAVAAEGGLDWAALPKAFRRTVGCPECRMTGFRGRRPIAEVLVMTPEMGEAIRNGASPAELRALAIRQGMVTLAADGMRRAAAGQTTVEEVLRVMGLPV